MMPKCQGIFLPVEGHKRLFHLMEVLLKLFLHLLFFKKLEIPVLIKIRSSAMLIKIIKF